MEIKPIRNERDYRNALGRVEALWDCREASPECDELDVLATLVEAYEREHYPIDLPDPIAAIRFRLDQQGKHTRDLVGIIGQRSRVHEVLGGKRSLSLQMIRNLQAKLSIPAHVLIQPSKRRTAVGRRRARRKVSRRKVQAR